MELRNEQELRAAVANAMLAGTLDHDTRRKLAGYVGDMLIRAVRGGLQAASAGGGVSGPHAAAS
jgi:hypothetical protein